MSQNPDILSTRSLLVLLQALRVTLPPAQPGCATVRAQEEDLAGVIGEVIESDRNAPLRHLPRLEKGLMLLDGDGVSLCPLKIGLAPGEGGEDTRGHRYLKEGGTEVMIEMGPVDRREIEVGVREGIEGRAGAEEGINIQERGCEERRISGQKRSVAFCVLSHSRTISMHTKPEHVALS